MSTCYCENCRERSAPGLVEAAPDLLAACEAMVAAIDAGTDPGDKRTAHATAKKLMCAAIAKARGGK